MLLVHTTKVAGQAICSHRNPTLRAFPQIASGGLFDTEHACEIANLNLSVPAMVNATKVEGKVVYPHDSPALRAFPQSAISR